MNENTHTPGPWYVSPRQFTTEIHDKDMKQDEHGAWCGDRPTRIATIDGLNIEANAALIVRAVNAHEALVAACEALLHSLEMWYAAMLHADSTHCRIQENRVTAREISEGFEEIVSVQQARAALAAAKGEA